MKDFFRVKTLEQVIGYVSDFPIVGTEEISLDQALGKIIATDIISPQDLPNFSRATMDGYAVKASSTFGASEGGPAFLTIKGSIQMGDSPNFTLNPGEGAKISTGGMLPHGADSVVMIEHAEAVDDLSIEVYKSVAPGQHVIQAGEDIEKNALMISKGQPIRPQEIGLLAAFGIQTVKVFKSPVIGIISTGDEIVPIDQVPGPGKIRDVNSYTLASQIKKSGAIPVTYGIVRDDYDTLYRQCESTIQTSDMVLVSGGSSVGMRDFTTEVLSSLPDSKILVHGISISPGKPTILANVQKKAFWGMPGHVTSAMVVFETIVRPFIDHLRGNLAENKSSYVTPARLSRNVASANGRTDFIRVKLVEKEDGIWAEPILGKSGLINSMVKADGLVEIGINIEGLNKGDEVKVTLL
ncbi:MAG: molybdopterin molybdotransferase MoeA [Deltaproteobacteria bacterium]|nr:molybdopterin molybdotransferase MoeA [Deltaproteobacteria bacterium]